MSSTIDLEKLKCHLDAYKDEFEITMQFFDEYPRQTLQDILKMCTELSAGIELVLVKMNHPELEIA